MVSFHAMANRDVPVGLPFNVPSSDKYPFARYKGLAAFSKALSYGACWDFVVDLGGKRDETIPTDFWERPYRTTTMLEAYLKLLPENRLLFTQIVYWIRDPVPGLSVESLPATSAIHECKESLRDPRPTLKPCSCLDAEVPPHEHATNGRESPSSVASSDDDVCWQPPSGDKRCYLKFFRADHRPRISREIGRNPWACAVAAKLLNEPGIWDSGKFILSFQGLVKDDGTAYVQAHVERSLSGSPITSLLPYLSGSLRVGASSDLNALVNNQAQDRVETRPTIFPTVSVAAGTSVVMNYSVYAMLSVANPSMTFTPLVDPVFAWIFGPYESVKLESASFTMQISTGAANNLWASVAGPGVNLTTLDTWLATPINAVINGSDQGYVSSEFILPTRHPFEPELRSPDPAGNPTPTFRFAASLVTNAKVIVKGNLRVRMAGQYAMGHINIGPGAKKSAVRVRALMVAALPYLTNGTTSLVLDGEVLEDDDEEESEAEEDAAGGESVPANVGYPRR